MALQIQKTPWIIAVNPESDFKMREMAEAIYQDKPTLFMDIEEADKAKALVSGAPFVLDKLYSYKVAEENELKEFLGLNNLGVNEKKEHLIGAEVDANNEAVDVAEDTFLKEVEAFTKRVSDVLGVTLTLKVNKPKDTDYRDEDEPEGEEDIENVAE